MLIVILLHLSLAIEYTIGALKYYNQSDYSLAMDHVEMGYFNNKYFKFAELQNTKFNRTTKTFTLNVDLLQPLTKKWKVEVKVFMFLSNEYRPFTPMKTIAYICDALRIDIFGVKSILQERNIDPTCPMPIGHYFVKNMIFNGSKSPPLLPEAKYKLVFDVYDSNTLTASSAWYGEVTKKLYWSKHGRN